MSIEELNYVFIYASSKRNIVAINLFQKHLISHLKEAIPNFKKYFNVLDGSPSQYKNRNNLLNICLHKELLELIPCGISCNILSYVLVMVSEELYKGQVESKSAMSISRTNNDILTATWFYKSTSHASILNIAQPRNTTKIIIVCHHVFYVTQELTNFTQWSQEIQVEM